MKIEELLECSSLKKTNIGYQIEVVEGAFGKMYIDFILFPENKVNMSLFLSDYTYINFLGEKVISFEDMGKIILNISKITNKVVVLCEKTKDEFVEEFRIDRPSKDLEQCTDTEEFNLIEYNVEVGSFNSYGDSWYIEVYSNKLETALEAYNYNKEELCDVLYKKHQEFLKKLSEIVFSSAD